MAIPEDAFDIVDAYVLHETDFALKVEYPCDEGYDRQIWIPKSVVHDDSEVYSNGDSGVLLVKLRWAEEKGLI